mmetsp:Transcript_10437/g.17066  ORF Transcript_10437/g.17066 Transcript_10437/m.17066 type:complete len:281 (+) Transcript_10437:69-911(+)
MRLQACAVIFCLLSVQSVLSASLVRFLHASPDGPAVDLLANDAQAPLAIGLEFSAITTYAAVPSGTYTFYVVPSNGTQEDAVNSTTVDLEDGEDYTIAAVGMISRGTFEILVKADHNKAAWKSAKIRWVNLAPELDHMDVFQIVDHQQHYIVKGLPYTKAANYVEFPEDDYEFHITLTRSKSVFVFITGLYLETGEVYSAFIVGLIKHGDLGGKPRIRAVIIDDTMDQGARASTSFIASGASAEESVPLRSVKYVKYAEIEVQGEWEDPALMIKDPIMNM